MAKRTRACPFCSLVSDKTSVGEHLDRFIPEVCSADGRTLLTCALHPVHLIRALRSTAKRPGVDVAWTHPDKDTRFVLSLFTKVLLLDGDAGVDTTTYRTNLRDIDTGWWMCQVNSVVERYLLDHDQQGAKHGVMSSMAEARRIMRNGVMALKTPVKSGRSGMRDAGRPIYTTSGGQGRSLNNERQNPTSRDGVNMAVGPGSGGTGDDQTLNSTPEGDHTYADQSWMSHRGHRRRATEARDPEGSKEGSRREAWERYEEEEQEEREEEHENSNEVDRRVLFSEHGKIKAKNNLPETDDDYNEEEEEEEEEDKQVEPTLHADDLVAGPITPASRKRFDHPTNSSSPSTRRCRRRRRIMKASDKIESISVSSPEDLSVHSPPTNQAIKTAKAPAGPLGPTHLSSSPDPEKVAMAFVLQISVLGGEPVTVEVYREMMLDDILAVAWKSAPKPAKAVRAITGVYSDDKRWKGPWDDEAWMRILETSLHEEKPPVSEATIL